MPGASWLQLNWELQNGGKVATEVCPAGRILEPASAIQRLQKGDLLSEAWADEVSHHVARRKTSSAGSLGPWRTSSRLVLPPTEPSTSIHPQLIFPACSPQLHKAPMALSSVLSGTLPGSCTTWFFYWLMETHMDGREGPGSGVQTTLGWVGWSPTPTPMTRWSIARSSNSMAFSLEVSALMERCFKTLCLWHEQPCKTLGRI